MIKISIVIPVFNKEEYIVRCFDSVLQQIIGQEDRYEILVVDDGSQDRSYEIAKDYSNKYSFFTVVRQDNSGVSAARNKAIRLAKGEYVLFLDGDDELIIGSLPKVLDFLDSCGPIDMLVTRQTRFNGDSERIVKAPSLEEKKSYTGVEAHKQGYVRANAGGGICRTNFLRENNINFPVGIRNAEDTIFFGLVQVYAKSVIYLNIPLYRIFMLEGSASRSNQTILALRHVDTINTLNKIRKDLDCTEEQKGIVEYVTYVVLCNTLFHFVMSPDLHYSDFRDKLHLKELLPLKTNFIYKFKNKVMLLNFSSSLFYFFSWVKHH